MIFEYNYNGKGLMMEAKIGGEAGFNVEIDVDNPIVSGSKVISLLKASEKELTLNIGSTGCR